MIAALALLSAPVAAVAQNSLPARVAELVREYRQDGAPGAVLGVVRRGELELFECWGLADVEAGRANTRETPFYVASLAKPFTAALAVQAAAEGAFDLDAPVTRLFPELPPACAAATLRQLLQHRSGIQDVYDTCIAADLGLAPIRSNAAAIELLARVPQLAYAPNTRMLYSNSGYVLLAEAVARTTGKSFASYAHAKLFTPLEMSHASFLGEATLRDAAKSYAPEGEEWKEQRIVTGLCGPGGLYLALDDLVRFERAWTNGEWPEAALKSALLRAPAGWHHPRFGRYASGWMLQDLDGLRRERHLGGAFGFSADLQRYPDQQVSVIALSNSAQIPAQDLATAVARIVLEVELAASKREAPAAVELSPEQRARFGRLWRDAGSGDVWVITPKPDHFVVATLGDLKLELVATSERRLEARDAYVPFAVELADGGLDVRYADGSTVRLTALPFPARDLPPVGEYAGKYTSAALGATIELEVRGDQLALVQHDPLLEIPPFLAIAPDVFLCDKGARIDFRRDGDGLVAGLSISANRAWNLPFERRGN